MGLWDSLLNWLRRFVLLLPDLSLSLSVSLPQSSGRLALSSPIRLVEIPPVCWIHSFGCFD
jgi:hypothetical protein